MNITEPKTLIDSEFSADNGLDVLFRLSADVEQERIARFIEALQTIEAHYQNEPYIERDLVYKLFSFHQTLQASARHWKVSRPEGLDSKTCFKIFTAIRDIFAD